MAWKLTARAPSRTSQSRPTTNEPEVGHEFQREMNLNGGTAGAAVLRYVSQSGSQVLDFA